MNISKPAIERPIATSLLTMALLLAGVLAYMQLPVSPLPQIDFPVISVGASLPGASPETMASAVATPLERQFGRIAGINQMTSSSMLGNTGVTMQFDLNRNIDAAARDVQAAINAARTFLPADLPSNPTYRKINPADSPVIMLVMTSEAMTQDQMYDAADSVMAQKLSQIEGVGQVFVWGSSQPAVRIEANPNLLNKLNIGLETLRTAVAAQNINQAVGMLQDSDKSWIIHTNDQLKKAKHYQNLIIAYRNGSPVRLSDVATVSDSYSNIYNAGSFNGKPSVLVVAFRQPGANIIATADRVIAALPFLQASLPASINLQIGLDRTLSVRASVSDVQRTLIISVILVVLVVFAFLREVRATLIPSVAVPLAIVGTFGVMYLCGYSLNNLSLMALTICTGFVVDDAIVVLENIMRHVEVGMPPDEAALLGAREIGFTVVSMSTSLIAVFIPILLMTGIVGRLFREFAVTLSAAIAVSLVVSLTTTPMLCARFLKAHEPGSHGAFYRLSERGFVLMNRGYKASLGWVLRHQLLVLLVTILTVVLNVYLYVIVPKGFFPQQDTGRLAGMIMGDQDVSFDAMRTKLNQFIHIVQQDPAVENVLAFVGGGGAQNQARMFVILKDLKYRKGTTADMVINRLRPKLAHIPGATLYLQSVQDVRVGGRLANALYQYTLMDENLDELNAWGPRLLQTMRKMPQLRDVSSDQQTKGLQLDLAIDRDTASRLGILPAQIDDALYSAYGQRQVSTMYRQMNQYHVVLEVEPGFQENPDALKQLYVHSSNGQLVPLSAFTHYVRDNTSLAVPHQGQFPAITISFNLAPGVSLGDAVRVIQKAELDMRFPAGIHASFSGTAAAFQDSLKNEPVLILAALVAVYIVLGMLYESYIHPITILSTLPSAGVGALLALLLFNTDLTIIALIGIILLIGIVKKNAIMMIDFALDAERKHGMGPAEAIYQASMLRFRPIMMTTLAAMFGALPLAIGFGTGAELRRPLGLTIVGGLIVSQMLTLFTTPVVYLYMDRIRWRVGHIKERLRQGIDGSPQRETL